MRKNLFTITALVAIIVAYVAIYLIGSFNEASNIKTSADRTINTGFDYNEIVKVIISVNGGVLQNVDGSVIVTIPPLKQDTEFTLSFSKSNYSVSSGIESPVTINISPDVDITSIEAAGTNPLLPITIQANFDPQYNLPVPYLINLQGKLQSVTLGRLDNTKHYFTMDTFHGGNYSWVYAN